MRPGPVAQAAATSAPARSGIRVRERETGFGILAPPGGLGPCFGVPRTRVEGDRPGDRGSARARLGQALAHERQPLVAPEELAPDQVARHAEDPLRLGVDPDPLELGAARACQEGREAGRVDAALREHGGDRARILDLELPAPEALEDAIVVAAEGAARAGVEEPDVRDRAVEDPARAPDHEAAALRLAPAVHVHEADAAPLVRVALAHHVAALRVELRAPQEGRDVERVGEPLDVGAELVAQPPRLLLREVRVRALVVEVVGDLRHGPGAGGLPARAPASVADVIKRRFDSAADAKRPARAAA